ncbi:MAG: OmpA family protein [Bacteroidales bacterium]|nr:OmpA family protein [Bacteroidales bacterium]
MFQKIKAILIISILIIGAFGLSAQTDTIVSPGSIISKEIQGEIVISKSDLIRFLDKVAKARKDKIEFELENIYLEGLNTPYSFGAYDANNVATRSIAPLSSSTPLQSMSQSELIREVEMLNSRLNNIAGYAGVGNTTAIITGSDYGQNGGYYPYQTQAPLAAAMPFMAHSDNGELRWLIDSLQQEVSKLSATALVAGNQEEISRLNKEIDEKQDVILASTSLSPEAREIVRSYGTSQMQVFFGNDVSDVSPRYFEEVKRAATVLRRNPQLAVVLKGYASTVGSARYNYELSMRRNEAVKRMMIDYGVFPDQITSVFYGEDKSSSASEARRVDIKFIIK